MLVCTLGYEKHNHIRVFPLESANCSTFWFWDWLLCFFPLRRLAEMENRNGSYLNDSISPNESMWEPLFVCLFCFCQPPHSPIGSLCVNWLCRLCFHWLVVVTNVSVCVYMCSIFWIPAQMIMLFLFASSVYPSYLILPGDISASCIRVILEV